MRMMISDINGKNNTIIFVNKESCIFELLTLTSDLVYLVGRDCMDMAEWTEVFLLLGRGADGEAGTKSLHAMLIKTISCSFHEHFTISEVVIQSPLLCTYVHYFFKYVSIFAFFYLLVIHIANLKK